MTEPRSNTRRYRAGSLGPRWGLAAVTDERSNCGIGGIVDLDGDPSHGTVADAVELLENLEHRGTTGAEENTGDGAGIMVARPDDFFREVVDADLPEVYAVGSVFMPTEPSVQAEIHDVIAEVFSVYGLEVLEWRSVPTDNADLGATALDSEPEVAQLFVAPVEGAGLAERFTSEETRPDDADPRSSASIARCTPRACDRERGVRHRRRRPVLRLLARPPARRVQRPPQGLAARRLLSGPDRRALREPRRLGPRALLDEHARRVAPRAHPYRNIVHNGEFNTIRGNVNWMRARENDLDHPAFGAELDTIKPVIDDPNQSDTASVDNAVELLLQAGRDLPHPSGC